MIQTTSAPRVPRVHRLALGVLGMAVALAVASQLLAAVGRRPATTTPSTIVPGPALDAGIAGADAPTAGRADLARIRADITFWSARATRQPADYISATEWASVEIELARATGDLGAWRQADVATTQALTANPEHGPAIGLRGGVLLALHRFTDARDLARGILDDRPGDVFALATLGDAAVDLGDYPTARSSYGDLHDAAPSAASSIRLARLAWIEGRPADAIELAQAALTAAGAEGALGERLAWYRLTLGDLRAGTSDLAGARRDFEAALAADPASWQAHVALARVDAADGRLGAAIDHLGRAIDIVPQPDSLARRADLLELRGAPGDAEGAAADRATVEVIAKLAGSDTVYDRSLVLYLANHDLEPDRAVQLAQAELAVRQDVYGHDALAWALLAAGRPAEADVEMGKALAIGTRDAKLLYHAGMVAAALGDAPKARQLLTDAIALDPSFDPLQLRRAQAALEALP